jgi:exopolysaccharide biosynthesis WecB/TagA/CpsF family protein
MTIGFIRTRQQVASELPRIREQLAVPVTWPQVRLGGVTLDLLERSDAVNTIIHHALTGTAGVLGVVSMNLDHLHHFGSGRTATNLELKSLICTSRASQVQWLALVDGEPLVRRVNALTGRSWPSLPIRELVEPLFGKAERFGLRIGFLGGSAEKQSDLKAAMARRWPALAFAGRWAPTRSVLDDHEAAGQLATHLHKSRPDILVVSLAKPRQERWIAEHARASGARVCLAIGAATDAVLIEPVDARQRWANQVGLVAARGQPSQPRRLVRRIVIPRPSTYRALRRDSYLLPLEPTHVRTRGTEHVDGNN